MTVYVYVLVDRFGNLARAVNGKFGYSGVPVYMNENDAKSAILTLADTFYAKAIITIPQE